MLGTLIAEALLKGNVKAAQAIRVLGDGENLIVEVGDESTGKLHQTLATYFKSPAFSTQGAYSGGIGASKCSRSPVTG